MQTISNVSAVASATVVATADLSAHGKSIVQQLDALSTKRQAWEVTDFKKANEGLYSLLSECLGVFHSQFVNASADPQALAASREKYRLPTGSTCPSFARSLHRRQSESSDQSSACSFFMVVNDIVVPTCLKPCKTTPRA